MPDVELDVFEAALERLLKNCPCDSCERYRAFFAAKVREYSRALRKSMGLARTLEEEVF